jgi:hypothetical protein
MWTYFAPLLGLVGQGVSDNLEWWTKFLQWASTASLLIPLTVGLRRRHRLDRAMSLLLAYIIVSVLVDLTDKVQWLLTHPFKEPYDWFLALQGMVQHSIGEVYIKQFSGILQQLFTLAEFALLMGVFISWPIRPVVQRMARISIPVFLTVGLSLMIVSWLGTIRVFPPDLILFIAESAILVLLSIVLLLDVNLQSIGTILQREEFWFSSAVLIYFAGNLLSLIFILGKQRADNTVAVVAIMHIFLNIISILLYARALQCKIPSSST